MSPEKFGKILTKLPKDKTLLKAESKKVELAIKDDLKKIVGGAGKIIQKLESEIKKSKEATKKYNETLEIDFDNRKKLETQIKKFKQLDSAQNKVNKRAEKIAKELGVQITDISNWNQFDNIVADGFKILDEAQQRIKSLD
tara:strand:- start:417 stop:839 length:423 start_codon:yes stop_codon:yes gene_type:complete